ncbi:Protein of unknown function DUF1677, plant [Dillenia turbinata]|uniref:Uncharacterized protein n=1 Tax=Dillenia turbinata TaxID=194707 RepID=A0AAN8Z727_9MAGN
MFHHKPVEVPMPRQEQPHDHFSLMNNQRLRKAVSDLSIERDRHKNDLLEAIGELDEAKQVECECCGLIEDCTPNYIAKVKDSFSGKWVCGLCSEAVKEKLKQISTSTGTSNAEEALKSHKDFCQSYNTTTRLNPKLSLTSAMRDIAKKSFESRRFTSFVKPKSKLTRTISCDPRINLDMI